MLAKESSCSAGDVGSIPGSGRSPGEGNGSPFQYSCLENPMARWAWQGTVHGGHKASEMTYWLKQTCKMYLITIRRGNEDLMDDLNLSWKWKERAFAGAAEADTQGRVLTQCAPEHRDSSILPGWRVPGETWFYHLRLTVCPLCVWTSVRSLTYTISVTDCMCPSLQIHILKPCLLTSQ